MWHVPVDIIRGRLVNSYQKGIGVLWHGAEYCHSESIGRAAVHDQLIATYLTFFHLKNHAYINSLTYSQLSPHVSHPALFFFPFSVFENWVLQFSHGESIPVPHHCQYEWTGHLCGRAWTECHNLYAWPIFCVHYFQALNLLHYEIVESLKSWNDLLPFILSQLLLQWNDLVYITMKSEIYGFNCW